ncbi:MAG: hypothetical protein LBJ63_05720 [Prevotellaceae bacterium]|jgi:hypothetical protein|nr:hypothetical protein [Prevotellaceae bacterium]
MKKTEKINRLLDLYFAGETTITQENELKKYFASNDIDAEHKVYRQLFETFETEKSEKYPKNPPEIKTSSIRKKIFVLPVISTAIAASILLMTGIFQTDGSYVIINGNRINDSELALQIAQAKIDKISASLESSMKHVKSMNKIDKSLQPLQKVEYIKTKIQHTFEKIKH